MPQTTNSTNSTRSAWLGIALFTAMALVAALRSAPPAPRDVDTPAEQFSAARAAAIWKSITLDDKPHPLGSDRHASVRDAIRRELEHLGAEVELQASPIAHGAVGWVENIVARFPGKRAGKHVLLAAHYDSVGAGPGASDDGAGCAALLETARAIALDPQHENTIEILIDDGEEVALLGAAAFVADRARANSIGVVVNFEARGTCGRSHMFETSEDNAWLIEHYARAVPHPAAVSVAYELYKRMPNDTDMTVFKRAGLAGLNFAFIGGVARYHTPKDDIAHLDLGSLQHHGDSALALAREFADANLENPPKGRAVYTDVLGLFFVSIAESWCLPLAIAIAIVLAFATQRRVRARDARASAIARAACAAFVAILAAAGIAQLVPMALVALRGVFAGHVDAPWTAYPLATRIAVYTSSLAAGLVLAAFVRGRNTNAIETRLGVQLFFAAASIASAAFLPSACYVFLAPCFVAALVALVVDMRAKPLSASAHHVACAITFVAAAALLLPLALALEEGFEFRIGAAIGAQIGLLAAWIAPFFVEGARKPMRALALTALAAFAAACFVPAHTQDAPTWLNFGFVQDFDTSTARIYASPMGAPLPESVAQSAAFSQEKQRPVAWWGRVGPCVYTAAETVRWPCADLVRVSETREGELRIVRAQWSSSGDARRCAIFLPQSARLRGVNCDGAAVQGEFPENGAIGFVGFNQRDPADAHQPLFLHSLELEIAIRGDAPCPIDILELSWGLPASLERATQLLASRPAHVVPRGDGDVTVITRRVQL